ncbi:MAG: hypothetical protein M1834_005115 [Cirrosporium novae-zelandiae]|nr:MAG: hypothetical protein M1834_005115 [Cirrosporium novae-zelandiae]
MVILKPPLLILLLTLQFFVYGLVIDRQQQQQQSIHEEKNSRAIMILQALRAARIIPDVLPTSFVPSHSVVLTYPQWHNDVDLGRRLHPKHLQEPPAFVIIPFNSANDTVDKIYTLILTDPDAPSRSNPKWSEICHWIATNITVAGLPEFQDGDMRILGVDLEPTIGQLIDYMPPSPPPNTGFHRYVFVLLEGSIDQVLKAPQERKHWGYGKKRHGVRDWAKDNELKPVGANFFYARNEEYYITN